MPVLPRPINNESNDQTSVSPLVSLVTIRYIIAAKIRHAKPEDPNMPYSSLWPEHFPVTADLLFLRIANNILQRQNSIAVETLKNRLTS